MNPNYMNFFDPSNGGMPMGSGFNNQSTFSNMNSNPSSFLDMINGPPMMPPTGQQSMPRFNPYSSMYGPSAGPYGMENSAARLQQFARQLAPRPNPYGMAGHGIPDQMALYNMQQQMRMRLKQQMSDFNTRQRFSQHLSSWPRMPPGMPQLQQQTAPRNSIGMMHNAVIPDDPLQMNNMPPMQSPQPQAPFRKMPVLDEAPPSLRGQPPLVQQQRQQKQSTYNSQQFVNRMFGSPPANTVDSSPYSATPQQPVNLNSDSLNLPNMNFPSPQQTQQHFMSNFTNEINNLPQSPNLSNIPQSPKLTHFGPSPASSVSSFEQLPPNTTAQNSITATAAVTYPGQATNPTVATAAMNYTPSQSFQMSPPVDKQKPTNSFVAHGQKFQTFFLQMENIQQQINRLKLMPPSEQITSQIQLLSQQYQSIFRQYEEVKQQSENLVNKPGDTLQLSTSQSNDPQQQQQHVLLEDPLMESGLNIPELDGLDNKDNFLNDENKNDSLFSAAFLGGSDLFPASSLFGSDSLGVDIKLEDEKKTDFPLTDSQQKPFQEQILEQGVQNSVKSEPGSMQSQPGLSISSQQQHNQAQYYQSLQPLRPVMKPNEPFLPFPFHHPQFAPQQNQMIPQHMLSVSDFLPKSALTTTITMTSSSMNPYTCFSNMPPSLHNFQHPRGGKGKGKSGKGSGKVGGKGKGGRPSGKKKNSKELKKASDFDPDDFDNLAPNELLQNDNDPEMKRSLRERTKKKNYKDDFDYNLSDEDEKNKAEKEGGTATDKEAIEPVISGGVNQLVAYRPNLEAEGEIAIIEKILAMRMVQAEQVVKQEGEESSSGKNVEEFFVKYKGYSYLHCEWGTVEYLAKKDKRVHAKVKRFKQKRDMSYAFLNELDDEPFNPDYLEIDRVLDEQTTTDPVTNEKIYHYLVKWRALPYEESTWELQMNIDEAIIKHYEELKKPPPEYQRRYMQRPHESEWRNYTQSPMYKNGNKLHNYQLEGLNWLTFCWFKGMNCILADEMGLGKTIQSISLLCAIKQCGIRGPFLVIAPLSTIANWQREFESWSDINAIVYHGSALSRNNIQQYEMYYKNENGEFITSIYKFEAIITTYEMVLSANSFFSTIPFRCLVIDEAHRLKNQKCKLMEGLNNLQMDHVVLLTGTPLQNNVEELFSLLNFLEPTRFPSQAAFMYEFGSLKTESQVEKLQQILKPMMLRRLKEDVDQNIAAKEETIVEVELTTIQKKFYRAILEKNFSFLAKGGGYANLPNLMNTMMELRKCCNHPFLIKGAEDKIVSDYLSTSDDPERNSKQLKALIESSGKMVLIDKLLPKLKDGGHKVLIFSQMIKVLNLIEDYLLSRRYLYERIDGGVQGNVRQAAIDRFCRPDSDRFVFLLCTRAGGLGINLTAADTVIIFDSDWNPQNDLQAQARCHRIGQEKPVKVYRLICRNTYEREMFDRASLKLGLDKAVLQNMNNKDNSASGQQAMSKKEVEELLKKGAYGAVMENDEDANNFCEEDIDQILQRRTQIVQIEGEGKGSTFAKASFVSDKARQDIDLDDPDFWKKWARKASVDLEELEKDQQLIVDEPRKRKQTKRFGNDGDATVEMSDLESDDETYEPHKSNRSGKIAPLGPIERAAWTRVECFKVEKMLLIYGWSRWQEIISHAHFRQEVRHADIEAISRTILAFCYRHYKIDERSKQFFVDLINESVRKAPLKNDKLDITNQILGSTPTKGIRGRKRGNSGRNALRRLTHQYSKPALVECGLDWLTVDPDTLIIDAGYRKHLLHHCNKIMTRVRFLHCLHHDIIKEAADPIMEGKPLVEVIFTVPPVDGELPAAWWDDSADKSLLMGTFKHGYEKYRSIRNDPCLSFYHKLGPFEFNEKVPGSPDSINNPASVERTEDASDPEFSVFTKKKSKSKKDVDEEDSLIESEEEKETYSLTASPASVASSKDQQADVKNSTNSALRWPLATDMNTRLRRLVSSFLRSTEKEYLDVIKAEKDKQKQEKLAQIAIERQRKKAEMQQKWTRREESDFYRIVSNYGVVYNRTLKKYNWDKFRIMAKLDKKQNGTLTAYYEEFMAMCRKVCGRSTEEDMLKYKGSQLEEISEERASRCIQRIKLLSKIREQVLVHSKLEERLRLCQKSMEFPTWWVTGKHDKALLEGVAKHGLWRTEYHVLLDPESVFKEIVDKSRKNKQTVPVKSEVVNVKMESPRLVNGEHADESLTGMKKEHIQQNRQDFEDSDSRLPSDIRIALPVLTDEYAHILSSWPKEKIIVSHLDKVCMCVIKGEWPKATRFDINPVITKLPVLSRPIVSTVGHFTRAEFTSDKTSDRRGEEAAGNRDFKIKSIDGLKLTVKTEAKKRKRKVEINDDTSKNVSVLTSDVGKVSGVYDHASKYEKTKRSDGISVVEVFNRQPHGSVQIHIPKTAITASVVSSHRTVNAKHIIHFPANVKVPKVAPSTVKIPTITSPSLGNIKLTVSSIASAKAKNHATITKTTSIETPKPEAPSNENVKKVEHLKDQKHSDQPVGIHIDSPNANVRIVGSKIEVTEKPSIKRKIDMSEVILKVPDPSKFLPNKEVKKRPRSSPKHVVKPSTDVFSMDHSQMPKVAPTKKPCEHRQASPSTPKDNIRTRPERSAKKRAKDSISEITEAEHMSLPKELMSHDELSEARSHKPWPELHSPSRLVSSRDYFRYEYFTDRSPLSPEANHRRNSRSPIMRHRLSPERRIHSPPLHSLHGRPLSPARHRHNHSPPRHFHDHGSRLHEIDDHINHLHYTEPLSPRYRGKESHFYHSDESRSPFYYEYRHDKERAYSERLSPVFKHGRLSPGIERRSPISHKHETFPFVHLTEPRSPPSSHKLKTHRHDIHSPVQEGRFPYGHVHWEGSPKYKRDVVTSSVRSPPLDSYQYQPLSRLTPESKSVTSHAFARPDHRPREITSPGQRSLSERRVISPDIGKKYADTSGEKKQKKRLSSESSKYEKPLSFYPADPPKSSKEVKVIAKPKPLNIDRSVIEIPEQTGRIQSTERKTPTTKRKGIGLLEMKIQGLKKQKMGQFGDNSSPVSSDAISSSFFAEPTTTITSQSTSTDRSVTTSKSKSISDVINSLSTNIKVASPNTQNNSESGNHSKQSSSRTVKSLHLDAIAKNLSRSLGNKVSDTVALSPNEKKHEEKKPTSKFDSMILKLKEKKEFTEQTSTTSPSEKLTDGDQNRGNGSTNIAQTSRAQCAPAVTSITENIEKKSSINLTENVTNTQKPPKVFNAELHPPPPPLVKDSSGVTNKVADLGVKSPGPVSSNNAYSHTTDAQILKNKPANASTEKSNNSVAHQNKGDILTTNIQHGVNKTEKDSLSAVSDKVISKSILLENPQNKELKEEMTFKNSLEGTSSATHISTITKPINETVHSTLS